MGKKPLRPKARRRLSRAKIQDILRRNLQLYKDEESLIPYLVDLAIYLLEYEYDWEESDVEKPAQLAEKPPEPKTRQGTMKSEHESSISYAFEEPPEKRCQLCGASIGNNFRCPRCGTPIR